MCVCVCESDRRVPRRASAAKKKKEDDDDDDDDDEEAEVGQETGVFLDGHNLTIKGYFSWL